MKKCSACGKELPDHAIFCEICGGRAEEVTLEVAEVEAPVVESPVVTQTPVEKKSKKGLLILMIAAAAVVLLAVVGLLTNWFGLVSPLNKIGKAVMRTADADSITIKYRQSHEYGWGDYEWEEEATIKAVVDKEKNKATILVEDDNSVSLYEDGDEYYYRSDYEDGRDYANVHEGNPDEVEDVMDEVKDVFDGKKINWGELVEKAELEDEIDKDEIDAFLKTLYKECLNNRKWRKECLGYQKDGKTYTFEPDVEALSESLIELCDNSDAFSRLAKREIESAIEDLMDSDVDITLSITLKGRYVSKISLELKSGDYKREIEIEISDVNETEIDANKVIDKVERIMEENACDRCGEYYGEYYAGEGEYWCYDCYYTCEECGGYGADYERDGMRVCWNCQYECDHCGDTYGSDEYTNGELCYDCYYTCENCGDEAEYTTSTGKRVCYYCYRYYYY